MLISGGDRTAVELPDTLKVKSQCRRWEGPEGTVQAVLITGEERFIAFYIMGCATDVR